VEIVDADNLNPGRLENTALEGAAAAGGTATLPDQSLDMRSDQTPLIAKQLNCVPRQRLQTMPAACYAAYK
jgi:hypothetical protein